MAAVQCSQDIVRSNAIEYGDSVYCSLVHLEMAAPYVSNKRQVGKFGGDTCAFMSHFTDRLS